MSLPIDLPDFDFDEDNRPSGASYVVMFALAFWTGFAVVAGLWVGGVW